MKSSPFIFIYIVLTSVCIAQPLQVTTAGGNFLSDNELLTSNYDDNFEDRYEISEMNSLLDENGFHFNQQDTQINSEFSEIPSGMYRGKFIMVSSKKLGAISKKGENESPNSNVYCLDINEKGELSRPLLFSRTLNSTLDEGQVAFSQDELHMYFTRVDEKTKNYQLFISKLDAKKRGRWGKPIKVIFNNPDYSIENPFIKGDKLYFSSNMPENNFGGFDLYVSQIHPNGNLSVPENLGEAINTSKDEKHPFISADKNYFYFSSNGHYGYGGFDVFRSRMYESTFKAPKNIGASVNTEKDELGFYLLDRNLGFVASNGNSNNTLNISKIEMTSVVQFMKGKVFDSSSKKIISDATINLYDEYGTLLNSQNTSSRGFYYFNVIPLDNYTIEVIKKDYTTLKSKFSAHKTNNNTYLVNLEIEKQVIDQENKLPKTNISPENGDSDFFKKQSPNSSIKEDKNLNKKSSKSEDIGETDFFKKYSPDKE